MTTKTYTTEFFSKNGKIGGDYHKLNKPPGYFSKIAKMRKNPGRKRKSTLTNKENKGRMESNRANKRNEVL